MFSCIWYLGFLILFCCCLRAYFLPAMNRSVKYVLSYKLRGERISLDQFDSVNDALAYCKSEQIEEPVEISRLERIEERVLSRSQIMTLLGRSE